MAEYTWPSYDTSKCTSICIALKNHSFVSYSEKDEISRINEKLNSYQQLTESENQFMEKMISQYGSQIET